MALGANVTETEDNSVKKNVPNDSDKCKTIGNENVITSGKNLL